jgi:hypothetical protein
MAERFVSVFVLVSEDADKLPPGYINVEDAANFLRVSDESVRRFISTGTLYAEKQYQAHGPVGWRWIIPTAGINRLKSLRKSEAP